MLIDNIIKCPWHGANFDIETGLGDLYPSLDPLEKFEINEVNGQLEVLLPNEIKTRVSKMAKRDHSDKRCYVIVGGGPAALTCAETLRQMEYTGEVIILTEENYVPYDRTNLTKWMPSGIEKIQLRSAEFLKEFDIDVRLKSKVLSINAETNSVQLLDGTIIVFIKIK